MKILTVLDIKKLIQICGFENFFNRLIAALENDFGCWNEFILSPRQATYYPHGVIELMPCADQNFYTFKYVNGHPKNPLVGKLTVVAIGLLSDASTGYPLLISEMTLLTALRTAATGVLAAKYLAKEDAKTLAIIGTGAQAEFLVTAYGATYPLETVRYFDIDGKAMDKFSRNLAGQKFRLTACNSIDEAINQADIIITATAAKKRQALFDFNEIAPGAYIHALGGDCPGKTELSVQLLELVKLVVEYTPQSLAEGEVQQCDENRIYAELWELVCKQKPGRLDVREITLFDAVGFALEDYSVLRAVHELSTAYQLGTEFPLIPELNDPKNLFGSLDFC
ncbi:ornithine cyclodeaminase [biofilm metagenome]